MMPLRLLDMIDINIMPREVIKYAVLVASMVTILYNSWKWFFNLYLHPLRSFPGPVHYAASNIPLTRRWIDGSMATHVAALHARYNNAPVIRIAPDQLSFINPAAFQDIYGYRHGARKVNFAKDPHFYGKSMHEAYSLVNAPEKDHSRQRRNISHAFSEKALLDQQGLLRQYIDLLIVRLKERTGQKLDMVSWYNFTTFDIIGDLAFGESFTCLEKGEQHPWVNTIFVSIKAFAVIISTTRYSWLFPLIYRFLPKSLHEKRMQHSKFGEERAMSRVKKGLDTDRKDFWTYIIQNNDKKYGLTEDEMKSNASLLVLAGSETTATVLSGTTYLLLKNRDKLDRLTREIRGKFKSEDEIDFRSVSDLPYLIACLEEGMRVYPAVPTGLPRTVPDGGETIAGHFVPGGYTVSVSQLGVFHSPTQFALPESYLPERWLDDYDGDGKSQRDPRFSSDNKAALQPFSVGPRNCIGRNLAAVEMRLILTRVLWNFDLELVGDGGSERGKGKDWTDQRCFIMWRKNPLWVTLEKRKF